MKLPTDDIQILVASGKRKTPRQYDEDYKREAVRLYVSSEKSVYQISRELCIPEDNLRKWIAIVGGSGWHNCLSGGRSDAYILEEHRQLHMRIVKQTEETENFKTRPHSLLNRQRLQICVSTEAQEYVSN